HYFLARLLNLIVTSSAVRLKKMLVRIQFEFIRIFLLTWVVQRKLRTQTVRVMLRCLLFFMTWRQINTIKKMCLTLASTAMSI
ncbi:pfkB carbohydrate kinase family protein, partial [Vibrio parahaemolyticus V-223/04]